MPTGIGDAMKKFMLFKDPAAAKELRSAGFPVFLQEIRGERYFATEESDDARKALSAAAISFDWNSVKISSTLCF